MKLNIGSGRKQLAGYENVDLTQYVDGKGDELVKYVLNIEKEELPFEDNSIDEILADNVLEHLFELIFPMNEMHRVLKPDGILVGNVPVAGSKESYMDPTHRRFFIPETFDYFCGTGEAKQERPYHPRYADYHIQPWVKDYVVLVEGTNLIKFQLRPRK